MDLCVWIPRFVCLHQTTAGEGDSDDDKNSVVPGTAAAGMRSTVQSAMLGIAKYGII